MGRTHNITPYRPPGRKGFVASFRDASGKRVTRGLGTRNEQEAEAIAAALLLLVNEQPRSVAEAPQYIPRRVMVLYFGADAIADDPPEVRECLDPERLNYYLKDITDLDLQGYLMALYNLASSADSQAGELRDERDQLRLELDMLQKSMLAHAARGASDCPDMADCLAAFRVHKASHVEAHELGVITRTAERFAEAVEHRNRPSDVTAGDVTTYLDTHTSNAQQRRRLRTRIGTFINWCAHTYGYPSVMERVPIPTASAAGRQAPEIHWHAQGEVEAAMAKLDTYWKAVVGTLAFAGLRLSELIWLRNEDVGEDKIWVTRITDPHGVTHRLKTSNSERAIQIAPSLRPLLEAYRAAGLTGSFHFFPIAPGVPRRERTIPGLDERWKQSSIGRRLAGDKHKDREGLLPEGMNARSLRRTFGSLLIRTGRTVDEVAAVMGNSREVVARHYARLLGGEVEVGL